MSIKAWLSPNAAPAAAPSPAPKGPNAAPIEAPVVTEVKPVLKADFTPLSVAVKSILSLFPKTACSAKPASIGPAIAKAVLPLSNAFPNLLCCLSISVFAFDIALLRSVPATPPFFKLFSKFCNATSIIFLLPPNMLLKRES